MSIVCADTSFLFSLVGTDIHTPSASEWVVASGLPITVGTLGDYELGAALRFAEFKKYISTGESDVYWRNFQAIAKSGKILLPANDLTKTIGEASLLSQKYVVAQGHRSIDVLLVASALVIGADTFLTFDKKQRALAQAEGLNTPLEIS